MITQEPPKGSRLVLDEHHGSKSLSAGAGHLRQLETAAKSEAEPTKVTIAMRLVFEGVKVTAEAGLVATQNRVDPAKFVKILGVLSGCHDRLVLTSDNAVRKEAGQAAREQHTS